MALKLEVDPAHGVPLTLVSSAINTSEDPEIDECWCLFDVECPEPHANLTEAINKAAMHEKVKCAISNPCFELWLVWHFQDWSRHVTTSKIEAISRSLDKRRGKSIDAGLYLPYREQAMRRAKGLAMLHERNGATFPNDNPSSGMHTFLETITPQTPH